jgi:hypothetical protein
MGTLRIEQIEGHKMTRDRHSNIRVNSSALCRLTTAFCRGWLPTFVNPRRIHQLIVDRFPAFEAVAFKRENMHDGKVRQLKKLSALLVRCIEVPEVLVEVHRRLAALRPIAEAVGFIGSHINEERIRVTDRLFTSFVAAAWNGVANGQRRTNNE